MNTTFPVSYTTKLSPAPSALELRLALDNAKRQYGAACVDVDAAWRGYEDAVDDGDREAIADFLRVALFTVAVKDLLRAEMEEAYAAYWARVN